MSNPRSNGRCRPDRLGAALPTVLLVVLLALPVVATPVDASGHAGTVTAAPTGPVTTAPTGPVMTADAGTAAADGESVLSRHAPPGSVPADDAGNVTLYRSPRATFGSAEAVRAAIDDGTVQPTDHAILGDVLVVAIDSDRLAERIAEGSGSETTRFLDALEGAAQLRIVQTNPTPNANAKTAAVGRENVTAYRAGSTTYVLVRTDELRFRYREVDRTTGIANGERFAVQFGYDLPEYSRRDTSGPVVELHRYRSEFDTNGYRYDPLAPGWVELAVDVEVVPGESLVARATLDDGRTVTARVGPVEGTGLETAWLDLRGVDPGAGYTLELVHDGEVVDSYEGTIREPRATLTNASLTRVDDQLVVAVTAELSHGGSVGVFDEDCGNVGIEYVPPGVETRVRIPLRHEGGSEVLAAPDEFPVLVRAFRDGTASAVLYSSPGAERRVGFEGSCPTPEEVPGELSNAPPPTGTTQSTTSSGTTAQRSSTVETPTDPSSDGTSGTEPPVTQSDSGTPAAGSDTGSDDRQRPLDSPGPVAIGVAVVVAAVLVRRRRR